MAWLQPEGTPQAIAASGAGLVFAATGHAATQILNLRRVAKGEGSEPDGVILVSEAAQQEALHQHLDRDGWLLSPEGALAAAAAWKALTESAGTSHPTALIVDFVSPLSETAEIARLLGMKLPVKLPAGTRVGGIIIPQ